MPTSSALGFSLVLFGDACTDIQLQRRTGVGNALCPSDSAGTLRPFSFHLSPSQALRMLLIWSPAAMLGRRVGVWYFPVLLEEYQLEWPLSPLPCVSTVMASAHRCCLFRLDRCAAIVVCWRDIWVWHSFGLRFFCFGTRWGMESALQPGYTGVLSSTIDFNDNRMQILAKRSGMPRYCPLFKFLKLNSSSGYRTSKQSHLQAQGPQCSRTCCSPACHCQTSFSIATHWPQMSSAAAPSDPAGTASPHCQPSPSAVQTSPVVTCPQMTAG